MVDTGSGRNCFPMALAPHDAFLIYPNPNCKEKSWFGLPDAHQEVQPDKSRGSVDNNGTLDMRGAAQRNPTYTKERISQFIRCFVSESGRRMEPKDRNPRFHRFTGGGGGRTRRGKKKTQSGNEVQATYKAVD